MPRAAYARNSALALVLVAVLPGGTRAEAPAPLSFTVLPVGAYKVGDSHVRMLVQIKNTSDKPVSFGFGAAGASGLGLVSSLGLRYGDSSITIPFGLGPTQVKGIAGQSYQKTKAEAEGCPALPLRFRLGPRQEFAQLVDVGDFAEKGRPHLDHAGSATLLVGLRIRMLDGEFACLPGGGEQTVRATLRIDVR
jgi:hypothetical protein